MDSETRHLDSRILSFIDRHADRASTDAEFNTLALDLFAYQFARNEPFHDFCLRRDRTPATVHHWSEIPPVPTVAFKETALRTFPAEQTVKTFRTSGTSRERRGEHHLDTLELYEASLLPTFRRFLLPDSARLPMLILTPPPAEMPDSSLVHMLETARRRFADESTYYIHDNQLDFAALDARLTEAQRTGSPVLLVGTAFAFVHLLDLAAAERRRYGLPPGSRLMETGGFKGRSREIPRAELYAALSSLLGLPTWRIAGEYGMTELASQFYDQTLLTATEMPNRPKLGPAWSRVQIVDPETLAPAPPGTIGLVKIIDLANRPSVLAVLTEDLGRSTPDGLELLGRAAGAEPRGCSLTAESLLHS